MKKSKTKIIFILSFVLLSVILITSMILLYHVDENRETVKIPLLVGKRLSDVKLSEKFYIESRGVYTDAPEGEIISQSPYADAERKLADGEKCRIEILVSLGQKRSAVPDIKGYHYTEAARILRDMGIEVRIVSVYGADADNDTVIRTAPDIGADLREGDRVTLFVGRQRIKGSVKVGIYVGMSREEAASRILMDGLTLGEIQDVPSLEANGGLVISQSIKEGSFVPYGTEIDITVGEINEKLHPFGRG